MRFTPKTEEEITLDRLLPEGQYAFEVIAAKDRIAKSGVEMIELQLRIYDQRDKAHIIYDYLLEAMDFKVLHFSESSGIQQKYLTGQLTAEDCYGKKGFAEIAIQHPDNPAYRIKNSVKDYISPLSGTSRQTEPEKKFEDSDIPF